MIGIVESFNIQAWDNMQNCFIHSVVLDKPVDTIPLIKCFFAPLPFDGQDGAALFLWGS